MVFTSPPGVSTDIVQCRLPSDHRQDLHALGGGLETKRDVAQTLVEDSVKIKTRTQMA